ncbi:MAG: methionine--tRNA ligase [Nitrosomonadales bacterium]
MKKIVVTSALPYANGSIHLGHLVEYIQTDIWVRFQRMMGNEVYYICADDTHGTPIMIKAQEEGIEPEKLIAKVHEEHSKDFSDFFISFDNFYSTNSKENEEISGEIFKKLSKNNKISKKEIEQFFDEEKNMFLPDRFIKGECPKCRAKEQYGDSCESCGATYNPTDLNNPYSSLSGTTPVLKKTEHYFFKLSECGEFLKEWLSTNILQKEAENKIQEWFESGLQDWDITRDAPYFGFLIPGETNKYFYVWLDAPIGYMASFQNFIKEKNINFDEFWSANSKTELYHFIGKDILYFHALFWPSTLEFSGYRKPTKIFAHGFLTVDGEKMSKSRGTFITARSFLDFVNSPETLRYYYASKLNDSMSDIDLNIDDFANKVNSDLVGKLINIASRSFGFLRKFYENKLLDFNAFKDSESINLVNASVTIKSEVLKHYESRNFGHSIRTIFKVVELVNEFISKKEPWVMVKQEGFDETVLHEILTVAAFTFRNFIILLSPVLPELSKSVSLLFKENDFISFDAIHFYPSEIIEFKHLMKRVEKEQLEKLIESNKK